MNENETDVVALLQRMQQQLTFLEKKLDTLLQQAQQAQAQPKPFNNRPERTFSKPFRPYGRPHRPSGGHGPSTYGQGQGGPSRPGQGGHPREGNFVPKKKPYFGQGRNRA